MSAQHTPGPWHRDGHNMASIIRCVTPRGHPDAKHVCGDYEVIARCEGENWEANARLIAAAPDMLAASIPIERELSLAEWASPADAESILVEIIRDYLPALRAAIARAEGRS